MSDTNIIGGYALDPVAVYGPSASRLAAERSGNEPAVIQSTPLFGAAPAGAGLALPSIKEFVHSPAGMTLIALVVGYVLFARVFGVS